MPENRHNAAVFARGARFFDGEWEGKPAVLFEYVMDARSKIGPHPATDANKAEYADAWSAYEAGEAPAHPDPQAPVIQARDHPDAKAEAEVEAAERQAAMDKKRHGGRL